VGFRRISVVVGGRFGRYARSGFKPQLCARACGIIYYG
jgi:hypothetical protein